MIQIFFLFAVTHLLFAQSSTSYPRTVMTCEMTEGGAELTEDKVGSYSYKGTYGFDGSSAGGEAKIDLVKKDGKCVLNIMAGEGARKISRSFSWDITSSEISPSISEASSKDGRCRVKRRYLKSVPQCVLPTATEPGNQCYGEAGRDLTAILPSGKPQIERKLIAYSGGMTIETDPGSRKGISIWRNPKDSKSWCYETDTLFPSECKKLTSRQEVKNLSGKIIGILEPQTEQVLFKQAKQPYVEGGYENDSMAPSIRLQNSETETNVSALGQNSAEIGHLKVLGNAELPTRLPSYSRPALNIMNGNGATSDCNGVVTPATSGGPNLKGPHDGVK